MGTKVYPRDVGSNDGLILSVVATDLGNAVTRYTYFNLNREGYKHAGVQYIITATTLSLEFCNVGIIDGIAQPGNHKQIAICTATDGTGATVTASSLATNFPANSDLIGIRIRIIRDATTPSNVGLVRTVTAHVGATGVLTLSSAVGATTSGVTEFELIDSDSEWGRLVSDPTTSQWTDATLSLTGAATHTASGAWLFDTDIQVERFRIKRLTTNATNALAIRLSRGR